MPLTFIEIVLLIGSVNYLSTVLVYKEGPYQMVKRARDYGKRRGLLKVLSCPFCLSVWLTIGLVPILSYTNLLDIPVTVFGITGWAITTRNMSGEYGDNEEE